MKIKSGIGPLIVKVSFLIAFGIAFAMDMITEGVFVWRGFYNVGEYYEPAKTTNDIIWISDKYEHNYYSINLKTKGKYSKITLDIDGLEPDVIVSSHCYESYIDENGVEQRPYSEWFGLHEGKNDVILSGKELEEVKFVIWANNSETFSFKVSNYQLWEKPSGTMLNAIGWFVFFVPGVIIIYRLVIAFLRKYVYNANTGEKISNVYVKLFDNINGNGIKQVNPLFRIFLWFSILAYVHLCNLCGWLSSDSYVLSVVALSFLLLVEAILYSNKDDSLEIGTDENYFSIVFWFALTVSVSNVVIYKTNIQCSGFFLMFVAGFLGYSLVSYNDSAKIVREINIAVLLHFIMMAMVCYLYRSKVVGISYNGVFRESFEFAFYLLFVWIVLLSGVHLQFGCEKTIYSSVLLLCNVICLFVTLLLIMFTHENLVLLLAFLSGVYFIFASFGETKENLRKKTMIMRLRMFMVGCAVGGIISFLYYKRLTNENAIITRVKPISLYLDLFKNESCQKGYSIHKDGLESILFYYRNLFCEQLRIWKLSFLEYNMLGHSNDIKLWGKKVNVLNGYIIILFRYGCTAGVLFIMLVIKTICVCIKKLRRDSSTGTILITCIVLLFSILELFSRVETPFNNMMWLAFYISMGLLMFESRKIN